MVIARSPSKISLPQKNPGVKTVLEYLVLRFAAVGDEVWRQRVEDGKVHFHDGSVISEATPYAAQQRVYYYREVTTEPQIPFEEKILFQDELVLVAYKPHFLPVTPGGHYVEECLQSRLRVKTSNENLQALHRIDRDTAGLVIFSVNPETRRHYHQLFATHKVRKDYQAIAEVGENQPLPNQQWLIENRLEKSGARFQMQITEGLPNSKSHIKCLSCANGKGLFELSPVTGKTHQLRVHMQSLGWPILHDPYYSKDTLDYVQPRQDYSHPLQLLARKLQFCDPITGEQRCFSSNTALSLA
ncbi:MAG: pseudouridine synthase [Pseudohongiellaceae bacterium]